MTSIMNISLGKAGAIDVDVTALRAMPQVEAYIFNYGLKQMLNDVHAGEKEADKKLALTQKKLDSLMRGEVAQARVGVAADPLTRTMRELAEKDLKVALAKIGKKVKDYDKAVWQEVIGKQVAKRADAYKVAAEAILAVKVAPTEDDIDLDDLIPATETDETETPETE